MELYGRFLMCLAIGLSGVGLVLHFIFDRLFCDWDPVSEAGVWMKDRLNDRHPQHKLRAEDIILDIQQRRSATSSTRLINSFYEKQLQLREMAAVEDRLQEVK